MKIAIAVVAALAMSGCVSVKDVREKHVAFEGDSQNSVSKVAACLATGMQGKGVSVNSVPLEHGVSLTQAINGQFGYTVFTVIDIEDRSGLTHVIAKGVGYKSRNPEKDYAWLRACL